MQFKFSVDKFKVMTTNQWKEVLGVTRIPVVHAGHAGWLSLGSVLRLGASVGCMFCMGKVTLPCTMYIISGVEFAVRDLSYLFQFTHSKHFCELLSSATVKAKVFSAVVK